MVITVQSATKRQDAGPTGQMTFDVRLEGMDTALTALLEQDGHEAWKVRQWFQVETSAEIDWYDNSQHKAFVDVSEQLDGIADPYAIANEIMRKAEAGPTL